MEDVNILCRICLRPDREKSHQSVFHTKLQIPSKIFLLSGVQVVECRNNPALICNQCVDDLVFADSIRKRCIEADEHFRSTIPKKFFSRGIDVTIRDNSWNKPSASHFSIVEVQGIIEKKSEQESEDEFLATFIKSEKQSEEESNDDQFSRQFRSSVYKPNTFGAVSRKLLKKHEDNDQTGDKSMRHCDLCEYQTVHKRHMIRHCQVHSSEIFDFRQRESPTQRRLEVDPANLVNCKYCKKPFKNSLLLDRHIKGSHNDRTKCPDCDKEFATRSIMLYHRKCVHLKQRDYFCEECPAAYFSHYDLQMHIRRHTAERERICVNIRCGKPFDTETERKLHMRSCPFERRRYNKNKARSKSKHA